MTKPLTALIILDGFGAREEERGNAIKIEGAKHISAYWNAFPHTRINASGLDVGLPPGQMGNSEVGHLNIGAGRIVYQEFTRVSKSITDGDFFENPAFLAAIENCKTYDSDLHLWGLVSDGGVHSHMEHLFALVELAKRRGLKNVFIHCFMDGRDVPPTSGVKFILELEEELKRQSFCQIATVMGRYYAMDRDNRWERVEQAYNALVYGKGKPVSSAEQAMRESYEAGETDEFVKPCVVMKNGEPTAVVKENDSVIFFNFRPDRARELTRTFIDKGFSGFERRYFPVEYVSLTQYDATFKSLSERYHIAYEPQSLNNTLGDYLSAHHKTQLRIAETEKYAHVTFFFNGGVEAPREGEDRALIASPKVATYDLKPEMSAYEVAEEAVKRVESGKYDVMILNFANPDMVGHTGVLEAAVKAVKAVDECVYKVVEAIRRHGGRAIITADHGNCEQMFELDSNEPFTAHTTNPVPLVLVDDARKDAKLREGGRLADLSPTLLGLMGMEQPKEMTGETLILA